MRSGRFPQAAGRTLPGIIPSPAPQFLIVTLQLETAVTPTKQTTAPSLIVTNETFFATQNSRPTQFRIAVAHHPYGAHEEPPLGRVSDRTTPAPPAAESNRQPRSPQSRVPMCNFPNLRVVSFARHTFAVQAYVGPYVLRAPPQAAKNARAVDRPGDFEECRATPDGHGWLGCFLPHCFSSQRESRSTLPARRRILQRSPPVSISKRVSGISRCIPAESFRRRISIPPNSKSSSKSSFSRRSQKRHRPGPGYFRSGPQPVRQRNRHPFSGLPESFGHCRKQNRRTVRCSQLQAGRQHLASKGVVALELPGAKVRLLSFRADLDARTNRF